MDPSIIKFSILVVLLFTFCHLASMSFILYSVDRPVIMTVHGPVMGVKKTSALGIDYYNFQKIPYAKPPIGDLKFKSPVVPEPWAKTLNCTTEGPACYHFNPMVQKIIGEEDCLHMNVYTKNVQPSVPKPVMVFIHGGAFMRGSSSTDMYGPDYLLEKDIVLVTFNYRIGALGFLTLEDPSLAIPGNAGIKDQNLALKWVRKNVFNFGGDPTNITLFGESAGGSSVHYHMISEKSKGLFDRAIVMSGCALNYWSVIPNNNFAERLATAIGWDGDGGERAALRFLKSASLDKLVMAQEGLLTTQERFQSRILFPFGPVIEPYVGKDCFIPKHPLLMCREAWSQKMDILIGGTSEEGLFGYKELKENPTKLEKLGDFECVVPDELKLAIDSEDCKQLGRGLKKLYYPDSEPSFENMAGYIDLLTDEIFWHGVHRTVLSRLSFKDAGATYLYHFTVDSPTFNHYRMLMCGPGVRGTCHADDLSYIFKNILGNKPAEGTLEHKTIQRMVGVFAKFAMAGDPNDEILQEVKWAPIENKTPPFKCLNIGENVSFIKLPETKRMLHWDSMYKPENLF